MNKVILLGNVCQKPELRVFDSGKQTATFSLATSKKGYTLQNGTQVPEQTEFHSVVVWNKLAEVAERYLNKGSKLLVEGEIRYRNYEDKTGQKRYVTEIHASSFEMCGSRVTENNTHQSSGVVAGDNQPSDNDTGSVDDLPF